MGREFKIKIVTESDSTGARQSVSDLNAVKEAGVTANTEIGEQTEKLVVKKGELKKMIREIGHEFPILGLAGRLAMNPILGGVALLVGTLEGLKGIFDGITKQLNEGLGSGNYRGHLAELNKASSESAVEMAKFRHSLDEAASAQATLQVKTQGVVDAIRAQRVAQAEMTNAQKAEELARIDMLEKQGKVTEPEAINKRLGIEDKYSRIKQDQDIRAQDATIEAKRKELKQAQHDAAWAVDAAEKAEEKSKASKQAVIENASLKEQTDKDLAEVEKQVHSLTSGGLYVPGKSAQLDSAMALRSQLIQRRGRMSAYGDDLSIQAAIDSQTADASRKRAVDLTGLVNGLGGEIPSEQRKANAGYSNAGRVAGVESLARAYSAAGDIASGAHKASEGLDKALQTGAVNMMELIKTVEQYGKAQSEIAKRIRKLEGKPGSNLPAL